MSEPIKAQPALSLPTAIILGAIIIAVGVAVGGALKKPAHPDVRVGAAEPAVDPRELLENLPPVTDEDHIRGEADAPVIIVEYSDFECPFCKRFHDTMNTIIAEYGETGQVAWVFRHMPLEGLHPIKARKAAIATECAAEQGGTNAFWQYADRFFEVSPSNNRTDTDVVLPQVAEDIGLDADAFAECLESGRYDQKIIDQTRGAAETGGRGTPWSIVVTKSGEKIPLNGAQPIEVVRQIIDAALAQ